MRIAVYGSWREYNDKKWILRGSKAAFEEACQQIGRQIALKGHCLLVDSEEAYTADYHTVQGVLKTIAQGDAHPDVNIEVMYQPSSAMYEKEAEKYPNCFSFRPSPAANWDIGHLFGIKAADSILTIGGGESTYHAGIAAIVAGKRVVACGSFGGASLELLNAMDTFRTTDASALSDRVRGILRGPWTKLQLDSIVQCLGLNDYPRLMIIHGRNQDWRQVKNLLTKDLGLTEPIVMGQHFVGGKTLPEKFEQLAVRVDAAIAIATPDDIGAATLSGSGELLEQAKWQYQHRARQNVWIEVGWVWGNLTRSRILIITKGDVEIPSDLSGIETHNYSHSPSELTEEIRMFIKSLS